MLHTAFNKAFQPDHPPFSARNSKGKKNPRLLRMNSKLCLLSPLSDGSVFRITSNTAESTLDLSTLSKANILCKSTLTKKRSQCNPTAHSLRILSLILYDFAKSGYVNRVSDQIYNILFLFNLLITSRGYSFHS